MARIGALVAALLHATRPQRPCLLPWGGVEGCSKQGSSQTSRPWRVGLLLRLRAARFAKFPAFSGSPMTLPLRLGEFKGFDGLISFATTYFRQRKVLVYWYVLVTKSAREDWGICK